MSSRKSHTTRRRGRLRAAISTAPDLSGSGRVDMLTCPAAAARAAVATGASGEIDTRYVSYTRKWKCGSLSFTFTHPPRIKIYLVPGIRVYNIYILVRLEIKGNPSRITLLCDWLYVFIGRADFEMSVRFDNTTSCVTYDRQYAGSRNSACLLALSRSDRHVLALLLCAGGLIALCCAVLAVDARQDARTCKKNRPTKRKTR